ncbi:bifunctional 4-hydroxy-2-oxoglutarate aldolase/2-dehydro-3-deoxy-phosphogluconate aldolase [candidate division KSB1 bacterium]|nr:bifunctional 4-hydroxy-2-oxoglutarate aldolase/2-dehydro-3-deoxy-phosphogluconate aldolase [candidate division KSB1 bacterium]RQW03742.1 MAG: bifunctional 4-hydroxy-2-oxoglutarate aldolase/2-dehydro-3-deoxy-phosphogluconate aldolase [candidate division KSB1 bacterium]
MARFDRLTVYKEVLECGLVPLFYNADVQVSQHIVAALAQGGARIVEFTNRGDKAHDVFKALGAFCEQEHPQLVLGVGSVLDAPTAALYIAAGANFIVAPIFDIETARLCNKRKIPYIPGCGSVNEISTAEEWGVEIVKIFPGAQVGGPGFVKAVRGPMPWTRLMPTGGVDATRESIDSWIKAGACAVGMGSKLVTKELVAAGDYVSIRDKVRLCLDWIREARG